MVFVAAFGIFVDGKRCHRPDHPSTGLAAHVKGDFDTRYRTARVSGFASRASRHYHIQDHQVGRREQTCPGMAGQDNSSIIIATTNATMITNTTNTTAPVREREVTQIRGKHEQRVNQDLILAALYHVIHVSSKVIGRQRWHHQAIKGLAQVSPISAINVRSPPLPYRSTIKFHKLQHYDFRTSTKTSVLLE